MSDQPELTPEQERKLGEIFAKHKAVLDQAGLTMTIQSHHADDEEAGDRSNRDASEQAGGGKENSLVPPKGSSQSTKENGS